MSHEPRFSEDTIVDHANSLLFSCAPEQLVDEPADAVIESLCAHAMIEREDAREVRVIVARALASCSPDASQSAAMLGRHESVSEILHMFAEVPNGRLVAHVMLLLINRNPYSEVQIARLLGVTKAAVSKVKVQLQERYGLKPRCGRSDEARETFADLCRQRHNRRLTHQAKSPWPGMKFLLPAISQN